MERKVASLDAAPALRDKPDGVVPALDVRHLSKSFGGTAALTNVNLTVLPGEVHGLLGQNGSGKSTLIKILAGYHAPDTGELAVHGRRVQLPLDPGRFRQLGLSFVHQDLGLIPSLTVLENLIVGRLATERRLRIDWRRERRRARELFDRYNVYLDPRAVVGGLAQVDRALLAMVRAVHEFRLEEKLQHTHGVLVLDEPTVFLPKDRTERLFALVRQIASTGASVLFVSHDLDEVREATDRITVLRDGMVVGTTVTAETSEHRLVEMIVGRQLDVFETEHRESHGRPVDVRIEGVSGTILRDFALEIRRGEIVGLTGLIGSGFEEVPYLLFGVTRCNGGRVVIRGKALDLADMSPRRAVENGMALIPADRPNAGSVGSVPIVDNVMLLALDRYRAQALQRRRMTRGAAVLLHQYEVVPPMPKLLYEELSGGNQQKVMLAKWLQTQPSLLLFDEPTQGVDVGARQQIYRLIRDAVDDRAVALCASADHEQLATICDRVIVLGRGRMVRELRGAQVTKDRIAEQCYNSIAIAESMEA